ncbi:MAG: leucyl aminopeptidase [Acidobacteria bacterium]|nr:leucyl aminopeptidase [Acidobacteriota bacterium]MBI3263101.1 leucyl aminopeptidase [Acidobacteriota bacterium]
MHDATGFRVTVSSADPWQVETELLVIPLFEQEPLPFRDLEEATGGEIARALASSEFKAKLFELFVTPAQGRTWRARRIAVAGAGAEKDFTTDRARKLATATAIAARQRRVDRIAYVHRGPGDPVAVGQAVAEGFVLAAFNPGEYKTEDRDFAPARTLEFVASGAATAGLAKAIERGRLLAECSNLSRRLCNEPGSSLPPRLFAERAAEIASVGGVTVEILDEQRIAELGMGLLLGVARGSHEKPRVIIMTHEPPGAPPSPVLGLVGKGITFDTGGISIKPADGMERMKDDMSGGAAVACAMRAIGLLGAPIRVVGVVPSSENMPGGAAIKPGDVLRGASGKTVEVLNTDAEGRLILGDALWYARQLGATHLVDVATLTGACVVALGKITTGLFGTPDAWVQVVREVADKAGDRAWPMPVFEEYKEQLKSDIADLANVGGRPAGAITAALFLKEFTGGLPWVHLDIAGTAWAEEAKPFMPKGPTGVAARTLAELAFTSDRWRF